jgi:hypothetical protein
MASNQAPSEAQRTAFVAKLNQFRRGLDENEQQMLDALVGAARQAHEQHDVEVYWFNTGLSGAGTQPYGSTSNVWSTYEGGAFPTGPFA